MAIFSTNWKFSDNQAITADAASTNSKDLGAMGTVYGAAGALERTSGAGKPINLLIQVVQAFATCTSVTFQVQVDDNSSFSSPKTVIEQTVLLADLVVGARTAFKYIPRGVDERYMRLFYVVNGSDATAGAVTAGVVMATED